MLNWIKKFFGWAEHEIEDIVSGIHAQIDKLESLVDRKQKMATDKEAEAAKAAAKAQEARSHANHAMAIKGKLLDLVAKPAPPSVG